MTKSKKLENFKRNLLKQRFLHRIIIDASGDDFLEYMVKHGAKHKDKWLKYRQVPLEIMKEILDELTSE